MRIAFRKISDELHRLEVQREDESTAEIECETRSYLLHDLLHYAVEGEGGLESGFWGNLAAGRSFGELVGRTGGSMATEDARMIEVERIVGLMSALTKGHSVSGILEADRNAEALGPPAWLTDSIVHRVAQRLRVLVGHWKAIPYGSSLDLQWPPAAAGKWPAEPVVSVFDALERPRVGAHT